MRSFFLLVAGLFTLASCSSAKNKHGNPVEVGDVKWLRNHEEALSLSKKTGKPVFLLFQEVPG